MNKPHRRKGWRETSWRVLQLTWALSWLAGCSAEVASDLAESEANQVIVALGQDGIAASKAPDPNHEGRFMVQIPQADLSLAVVALQRAGLPAERSAGVLDSLGESGLIASRQSEHARLVVGTAGELERSLREIAGVISVRVHLAVDDSDPLTPAAEQKQASASVLIRHRSTTPPLSASDVQRLVAGAVTGLDENRVAVVMHPVAALPARETDILVQMGPLSVSRSSMGTLRWLIAAVAVLNLLLLSVLLLLWTKLRQKRPREIEPALQGPS